MALTTQREQGSTPIVEFDSTAGGHRPEVVLAGSSAGGTAPNVQGNVATDVADAGNPVGIGANAQDPDALPAASTAGKRRRVVSDLYGRLITWMGSRLDPTNDSLSLGMAAASVGGMLTHRTLTLTNTAAAVKASAGRLGTVDVVNRHSVAIWVHLYDLAAGSVNPIVTVPKRSYYVPANGARETIYVTPVELLVAVTIMACIEHNPEAGVATAIATLPVVNIEYR